MKVSVISLTRTPERLAEFRRQNDSKIQFDVFPAIDGREITPQQLASTGYFDGTVSYTQGAIGNALSHLQLWERIGQGEFPVTICEDDAIFHGRFVEQSGRLLMQLKVDWDLVAWGWNFNAILFAELLPKLTRCLFELDQGVMRHNVLQYVQSEVNPNIFKLLNAFGTVCYTISPSGARKFTEKILPIRRLDLFNPRLNRLLPNTALDVMMNHFYAELDCFVAFPPLVLTLNDLVTSTVQAPSGMDS